MSEERKYVLDLTTEEPVRPVIRIDEVEYEMAVADDFEMAEFVELAKTGQKLSNYLRADITEDQAEAAVKDFDKIVSQVVPDLPDEVGEKLRFRHKLAIVMAFTDAAGLEELGAARQSPPNSSPGSPDSTEEAPETG